MSFMPPLLCSISSSKLIFFVMSLFFLPPFSISLFAIKYLSFFSSYLSPTPSSSHHLSVSFILKPCVTKSDSSMLKGLNTIISDIYRERANKAFCFIRFLSRPIMFCPILHLHLFISSSLHNLSLLSSKI